MPLSSTQLALRARRRSAKGVELELDVDARGWPATAAVVGSPSWRRRTGQRDLGDQLGPELACEVTLQPIDEFGFDAAILFSDVLITLPAMGIEVAFARGRAQDQHADPQPRRDRGAARTRRSVARGVGPGYW